MRSVDDDLTARARIRDAAIACTARDGSAATTVRKVAADAGVSPGLVLHHFGSKEGLRKACDDFVWNEFHRVLKESTGEVGLNELITQWDRRAESNLTAAYAARAMREGTEFGRRVFAGVVQDVAGYLKAGVASGMIRPSRDDKARAQLLTVISLGSMLLADHILGADVDPLSAPSMLADHFKTVGLDLYTEGLFTDARLRDAVLHADDNIAVRAEVPHDVSTDPPGVPQT